jgi:hypothetical protein
VLKPGVTIAARELSEADYVALAEARAGKNKRPIVPRPHVLTAYVNDGRWLADCPHCGSGIIIGPVWTVAICLGCYSRYASPPMPAEREAIEAALSDRPQAAQNWRPFESVAGLIAENLQRKGGG